MQRRTVYQQCQKVVLEITHFFFRHLSNKESSAAESFYTTTGTLDNSSFFSPFNNARYQITLNLPQVAMLLSSSHGLLEILFKTELRNVTLYYNFFSVTWITLHVPY